MTDQTIKDDVYMEIDNEFDQIRTALGMYISKLGTEGALHLVKEMTNNEFDECVNPEALGTNFDVIFDEIEQSFTTMDYSRGIPFDKMVDVCTKKHTSTKFVREGEKMKDQCGRNGVGLVVTAACSRYFSMTSYRGDQEKTVEFINGELKEHKPKKLKKIQHGLAVKFIPSSQYLKGDVYIEPHMIEDYFRRMSYIMRDDIKIKLFEFTKDIDPDKYAKKQADTCINYKRLGLSENVKYISSNLEFSPVEVVSITDNFDMELAFSYDNTLDDMVVNSYCNYVNTTEGGNHEIVAQRAICDFFCREAKKLDPNNKYEVTFEDCKRGLIFCVNCRHVDPAYEGQHKSRVTNADVLKDGKKGLTDALYKYFNANNALLRRIISYLRTMAKVRLEAHKIKTTTLKKQTTFLDDVDIPLWYPLANRNSTGYKELILAEGESAAIAIDNARNSQFQAVLGMMGVDNVYGLSPSQVMTKCRVFRNLVNILGCGIGKDFDITKLKYDKIIIETDADTDGSNIASRIVLFFVLMYPEIILQGKLYKALPPLLLLKEGSVRKWYKGSLHLFSKEEYYDVINMIISNNSEIALSESMKSKNVIPLKKKEIQRWLQMNTDYTAELNRLQKRAMCNTTVIEYVCYAYWKSGNNTMKFKKMIEDRFEELTYTNADRSINGSYNKEPISLIVDEIFWRSAKKFMTILQKNDMLYVHVKNRNDDNDRYTLFSIGEFLYYTEKMYAVKIEQRYKGLGEADAEILFATTLNPKIRKLVRFTIDDMRETLNIFEVLHARTPAARQERRNLLDNAEISYMDLDN